MLMLRLAALRRTVQLNSDVRPLSISVTLLGRPHSGTRLLDLLLNIPVRSMFDILMAVVFLLVAIRTGRTIYRERELFREFNQPLTLLPIVALFPISHAVAAMAGVGLPRIAAWGLSGLIYLLAWLVARKQAVAFQSAGTSRAGPAEEATSTAAGFAILGLGLVILRVIVVYAVASVHGD